MKICKPANTKKKSFLSPYILVYSFARACVCAKKRTCLCATRNSGLKKSCASAATICRDISIMALLFLLAFRHLLSLSLFLPFFSSTNRSYYARIMLRVHMPTLRLARVTNAGSFVPECHGIIRRTGKVTPQMARENDMYYDRNKRYQLNSYLFFFFKDFIDDHFKKR